MRVPKQASARLEPGVDWPYWRYGDWNDRLVEHCFMPNDSAPVGQPIERIAATPEELALIAAADPSDASAVAEAFVRRIVEELPVGKKSFGGFCLDYESWSPRSPDAPHFFAMLWFTCLVAYGYPTGEGGFFERLWKILGKKENFQLGGEACLPKIWRDAAAWTKARHKSGAAIRELRLPPRSEHRPVIGYSHFLAFPNRLDRNRLAQVLWDTGLIGFEPPLEPVLRALQQGRKLFSKDFINDLDRFVERYAAGEDPRESAFWRAVRQEALDPSIGTGSHAGEHALRTGLLFFADEEGLRPVIGCASEQRLPEEFEIHPFEEPVGWPGYVTGSDGDLEAAWRAAFFEKRLLPVGSRKLIDQGLLVIRESASGQYEVVSGADIHGCERALIKSSLVSAFVAAFPANSIQPSLVEGWDEVIGCEIRQVDEPPKGLESATQLLRTMNPPSVALTGGLHTAGGFLFLPGFLPVVRAPGAQSVEVSREGGSVLHQCAINGSSRDEWLLDEEVVDGPGTYELRTTWSLRAPFGEVDRIGTSEFHLVEHVIDDRYRGKPSGHYFIESCPKPEVDIGQLAEVPLGISTPDRTGSADLLELDASARFLGPGLGEMAFEPKPDFDWMVIGPKKLPELLVFVGDPSNPAIPAARRSTAADRRHWRTGFNARRKIARGADGRYAPLNEAPMQVREAFDAYRSHKVEEGLDIRDSGLETMLRTAVPRDVPASSTFQAVDAVAALGSRRAGLNHAQIRGVFQALLGNNDPIEFQQILRGWTEAGLIDELRDARTSRRSFVPQPPRFVMVRRGPDVEATLIGLLTTVRRRQVQRAIDELRLSNVTTLLPANRWQPSTLRLRCSEEIVELVRRAAGLGQSEWLDWPDPMALPQRLDISAARGRILRTAPPESYRFDASWDWSRTSFFRGLRPSEAVRLERRRHVDLSVIYVLTRDGEPVLWTYSRAWALLEAYSARGIPPFKFDNGILTSTGRAPVHLPLPVGRLCLLIGEALPGPTLGQKTLFYTYPFGPRLFNLVERVLPSEWVDRSA